MRMRKSPAAGAEPMTKRVPGEEGASDAKKLSNHKFENAIFGLQLRPENRIEKRPAIDMFRSKRYTDQIQSHARDSIQTSRIGTVESFYACWVVTILRPISGIGRDAVSREHFYST